VSFFFGSLVLGIIGAKALASYESVPTERIGAEAFLFLLCLVTSASSAVFYAASSQWRNIRPQWFTNLLGGIVAAAAFCASVSIVYAEKWLGFGFGFIWMPLSLVLPSLTGWWWPLTASRPN